MQTYIHGNFPVFEGFNHMQYQIRDPEGFARMLETIIETGRLPNPVVKKQSKITSSFEGWQADQYDINWKCVYGWLVCAVIYYIQKNYSGGC